MPYVALSTRSVIDAGGVMSCVTPCTTNAASSALSLVVVSEPSAALVPGPPLPHETCPNGDAAGLRCDWRT